MQVTVKGKNITVSEKVRARTEHKLAKLQRFDDRILAMDVEFSEERNPRVADPHRVEVTLTTKAGLVRAHANATDPAAAVDQVVDRLQRQVKKLKGRRVDRTQHAEGVKAIPPLPPVDDDRDWPGQGRVPSPRRRLRGRRAGTVSSQQGARGSGGSCRSRPPPAGSGSERESVADDRQARPRGAGDAIRVLIVDDHALFRRGLEMVLEQEDDVEVVGEAGDGAEAIEKAQELMPDVVLMDVRMPRRSGIEATQTIKDLIPHAKILMLTISDEEADLYDAIKAGANGYLPEGDLDRGGRQRDPLGRPGPVADLASMASKLLNEFATMVKRADEKQQVPTPRLTEREMEVLKLVAKGHNNRDIAKELYISENTVKNHIRNILEKLHLHSRMEAVVAAVREKLLEIKWRWTGPEEANGDCGGRRAVSATASTGEGR